MLFTSTYSVSTHDFWNLELRHHHDVDTNVFILLFLLIVCYYQKRGVSFFLTKRFSFVLHFYRKSTVFLLNYKLFVEKFQDLTLFYHPAPLFLHFRLTFSPLYLIIYREKEKEKIFRLNVINFPIRRYLFREQVTERGKLILKTCPF